MGRQYSTRLGAAVAAQLTVLSPDWLRALLLGQPMARRMGVGDQTATRRTLPLDILHGKSVNAPRRSRRIIDLVIPAELALERKITLPRRGPSEIEAMALLDMRQRTPFSLIDVYTRLSNPVGKGEHIQVTQWVLARRDVADWQENLSRQGYVLRKVWVNGAGRPMVDFSDQIAPGARHVRLVNVGLAVIAICAALTGWLYPAWHAKEQTRVLDQKLTDLRAETLGLRREVDALRGANETRAALLDTILGRPLLVDSLRELTVSLPDDVWIDTLQFAPARATMTGETTGSAADLVLALSRRAGVSNPRLSGPVSRTAMGAERFQITMDLGSGS